jgi:hypothetical protein
MAPLFNEELHGLLGTINLHIDWRAIAGCHVSRVHLSHSGPLKLGCVLLAWFTRNGGPVCHDPHRQQPGLSPSYPQPGDSPVTVDQAARPNFHHPWMSEERIKVNYPPGPVQLTLPAYDVERGYLLLDGAHRSIATVRAGVEYNVELAVIHGPIDQRVLRDLAVFERA